MYKLQKMTSFAENPGETILEVPEGLSASSLLDDYDDHDFGDYHPPSFDQEGHDGVIDDAGGDTLSEQDGEPSDGYFSVLPDELVQTIFRKLPIKDYILFSNTCTRMHDLSLDNQTWASVADGFVAAGYVPTREFCVNTWKAQKENRLMIERERRRKQLKKRKKNFARCVFYCSGFSIFHEILLPIALLIMFILIALKGDGRLDIGWGKVLIPFYPIIFFYTARIPAYLWVANCSPIYADEAASIEAKWAANTLGQLTKIGFAHYLRDGWFDPLSYAAFLIAGLVSLVLLTIQVASGGQAMMWTAVFSCFAAVGVFAIVMLVGLDETGEENACSDEDNLMIRAPALFPLIGFIISCIVIGLRLDDIISPTTDWNVVFTPIYITMGLMVVMPIIFCVINEFCIFAPDYELWILVAVLLAIIVAIPGYIFLPILASKLNGYSDPSNVRAFIPIFIQWALAEVAVIGGWCFRKCEVF